MKWPEYLMLIRHGKSAYNALKDQKKEHPRYGEFLKAWETKPGHPETIELAKEIQQLFALKISDAQTPLAKDEGHQAVETGKKLREKYALPDVIFVSPYLRAQLTLQKITEGWPELKSVKKYNEERIREQEHGLAIIYNDWRVFQTLHPEQRLMREQEGNYWYRYPQGENVPDVRLRTHNWMGTLIRDFAGKKVLAVTHHLTILSLRANFERLDESGFLHLDEHEKPINCGITVYRGFPEKGKNGKLELENYNQKFY